MNTNHQRTILCDTLLASYTRIPTKQSQADTPDQGFLLRTQVLQRFSGTTYDGKSSKL